MWQGKVLFYFFLLVLIAVFVKLFFVQVLQPGVFAIDHLQSRKILPERGKVFDRKGLPLAVNQIKYTLFVEPKLMKESKSRMAEKLDEVLEIGETTLEAKIDTSKVWVAVARGLEQEERDKIKAMNMPGIGFDNEPKRFYPEASLAAHLLGFVGKSEEGDDLGYFGVEGYYEKELIGLPGFMKTERDVFNKPIFVGTQQRVEPENGRDLVLTVDKSVQNIVKTKLVDAVQKFGAKSACVTVADPYTMEILAQACLPDFDPDKFYEASPESYMNTAISSIYEPGSTFKPLIMAAAIEEKAVKPTDSMVESGQLEISGYRIKNWNDKYAGRITMSNILEKSSNIGMVHVGGKLGEEKMYDYMEKYGFGEPTGIDLEGETGGYIKPEEEWYPIDYATASFGQGIGITQLQLLRAFSSLVNGGYLMKPYVVKEIRQGDKTRTKEPVVVERVLSERTSEIMKKMLESSVARAEMKFIFPKEYKIGGKTGTAQIALEGSYDSSKTIASFVGFAPVDKPRFIALVVVREPKTSQWGSETAAPIFFEIAKELFVYYNIVPE